jgi:large subunit ribosomal protein L2
MGKGNFLKYNLFAHAPKVLRMGIFLFSGRNFSGAICVQHRSSGSKHNYYLIDFFRRVNLFGKLYKIIKDAHRTAFIGGVVYENGLFSYIVLSEGLKLGGDIYSGSFLNEEAFNGCAVPLKDYSLFTLLNNVEHFPYSGASLARAAGSSCVLSGKKKEDMVVKFKTGWYMRASKHCIGTMGYASNMQNRFVNLKKAGTKRLLGFRPTVRGVAKNPCDHPHGGGEGKKSKPASPRSPWGWLTVGVSSKQKKHEIIRRKKLYSKI